MKTKPINIIKEDERGFIWDCGKMCYLERKEGSLSADHAHDDPEKIYLVRGRLELTIDKDKKIVQAPLMIEISPNEYHELVALTDISLILDRRKEKERR